MYGNELSGGKLVRLIPSSRRETSWGMNFISRTTRRMLSAMYAPAIRTNNRCGAAPRCPALPVRGTQQFVIDSPVQLPILRRRADEIAASPLLALDQGAVGRGRFPCAGVIDPGVAADDRSGPMLALEFGIVSERVMRHRGVRAEGRHLHVADVAALPLTAFILQDLYEVLPRLPVAPAVSSD